MKRILLRQYYEIKCEYLYQSDREFSFLILMLMHMHMLLQSHFTSVIAYRNVKHIF